MYFCHSSIKSRDLCLWSWAESQAPIIIVVRLGINGYSSRSCMESPTSHQEQVIYSKGNSSQKKKKLHQMEFLGGNYSSGLNSSGSSTGG